MASWPAVCPKPQSETDLPEAARFPLDKAPGYAGRFGLGSEYQVLTTHYRCSLTRSSIWPVSICTPGPIVDETDTFSR